MELDGWSLFWAHLSTGGDNSGLDDLRIAVASEVRERFADTASISKHPPVAAMRSLFRSAGCDPTRYRPASEALLRRLVKGAELPRIHPLVDLNNCLSARLAAPCCVMAEGSIGTSFVFRSGREGESYESLRGPFNLEAKPLLLDEHGPLDTPITGGVRVKVAPDTKCAWLVAYLPAAEISQADAWREVESMVGPTSVSAESFSPL
jgi:DNA/RNA-binding domain of Phe-tRNA-synthetase-like protein